MKRTMFAHVFASVLCNADMEQQATVAASGGDALEASIKAKKPRNPSVSAAKLVEAIKAGHLATPKLTGAQVAESLGMEQASFDQRLNQLRKEWEKGVEEGDFTGPFPFTLLDGRTLRQGTGKGVATKNAILAALFEVDSDESEDSDTDENEVDGNESTTESAE